MRYADACRYIYLCGAMRSTRSAYVVKCTTCASLTEWGRMLRWGNLLRDMDVAITWVGDGERV